MNPYRKNLYLYIERRREMKLRAQHICILLALASILLFMATSCSTQPRLPDPFDTALQSAIVQMFNTEGDPK